MELQEQILQLFEDDSEESFNEVALSVFQYQSQGNTLYKRYLQVIGCNPSTIEHYTDIPLLPIQCFKNYTIKTGEWENETIFKSSGTMKDGNRSSHYIKSISWYNKIALDIFSKYVYAVKDCTIISLLPSYIENGESSLVHMVTAFQKQDQSQKPISFLYNHDELKQKLSEFKSKRRKLVLFGVTYALLDLIYKSSISYDNLTVIYTGGMKGRKEDMSQEDIRDALQKGFPSSTIMSEYGMTEMQSQAYTDTTGLFLAPPTLRILTKEIQDPYTNRRIGKTGIAGVIDLANLDTCSFILTDDLAIQHPNRYFNIIGRMDNSDMRGCNMLYTDGIS